MRIDLCKRVAPLVLGGRVHLEPGTNEVAERDWRAVCDAKLTRWYFDQGIIVLPPPKELPVVPCQEPPVTAAPAAPLPADEQATDALAPEADEATALTQEQTSEAEEQTDHQEPEGEETSSKKGRRHR